MYMGQCSYTAEDRIHVVPIDRLWTDHAIPSSATTVLAAARGDPWTMKQFATMTGRRK